MDRVWGGAPGVALLATAIGCSTTRAGAFVAGATDPFGAAPDLAAARIVARARVVR